LEFSFFTEIEKEIIEKGEKILFINLKEEVWKREELKKK